MSTSTHAVPTWEVLPSQGYETAWVTLGPDTLRAHGRSMALAPEPYWLTYELDTGPDYVTRELRVRTETATAVRDLHLARTPEGHWTADGRDLPALTGALDCDLGMSPLTNAMPILRHRLHQRPGEQDFLMAWVAVPELTVEPMAQHYTHVRLDEQGARVQYASEGFTSELHVDAHGLVLAYPQIGHRITPGLG